MSITKSSSKFTVLRIVAHNGLQLEYASREFKADKEIVKTAQLIWLASLEEPKEQT